MMKVQKSQVKKGKQNDYANSKVKQVKLLRMLAVLGCTIVFCVTSAGDNAFVMALSIFPFTCLGGVCAYMYRQLSKEDRTKIYKASPLHIHGFAMHPYFLFVCIAFINLMCLFQ